MPLVANFHIRLYRFAPKLAHRCTRNFGHIGGVFALVSFLLAFAEHLGIQNAGEEDVDQLSQIIRATDCDVNFYLSPSNGFACGKNQIDTASRNKSMGTKLMESELVLWLVLINRFEAIEIWYRCF